MAAPDWLANASGRLTTRVWQAIRWFDGAGIRALLPPLVRTALHSLKKSLFGRPARLVVRAGAALPERVRIVIYGMPFNDWLPALRARELWMGVPNVTEVLMLIDQTGQAIPPAPDPAARTVVVPMKEHDIATCPRTFPSLAPGTKAVAILGDKQAFARYVATPARARFCPTTFVRREDVRLPCIVKPARRHERNRVVRSAQQLDALLATDSWTLDQVVVQALVPGDVEYTTHAVVRDGRVVWSCSFAFEKDGDVRFAVEYRTMAPFEPPAVLFEAVEALLAPLGYCGPCNVDYKLPAPGEVAIFEINPRFGGTLFVRENRRHLQRALACIVEHAVAENCTAKRVRDLSAAGR
jgi:hypothetical protein